MEYKPGCYNIADPLYRLSVNEDDVVKPVVDDACICSVAEFAIPCAIIWSDIHDAAKSCPETKLINEAIQSGDWKCWSAITRSVRNELSICDGVVLRGGRILIPTLQDENIRWS